MTHERPAHETRLDGKGGRRRVAAARAIRVIRMLSKHGVECRVVGSLATGHFVLGSDVDFLATHHPEGMFWKIESRAMVIMLGIEFDLSYRNEVRPRVLESMDECALGVTALLRLVREADRG